MVNKYVISFSEYLKLYENLQLDNKKLKVINFLADKIMIRINELMKKDIDYSYKLSFIKVLDYYNQYKDVDVTEFVKMYKERVSDNNLKPNILFSFPYFIDNHQNNNGSNTLGYFDTRTYDLFLDLKKLTDNTKLLKTLKHELSHLYDEIMDIEIDGNEVEYYNRKQEVYARLYSFILNHDSSKSKNELYDQYKNEMYYDKLDEETIKSLDGIFDDLVNLDRKGIEIKMLPKEYDFNKKKETEYKEGTIKNLLKYLTDKGIDYYYTTYPKKKTIHLKNKYSQKLTSDIMNKSKRPTDFIIYPNKLNLDNCDYDVDLTNGELINLTLDLFNKTLQNEPKLVISIDNIKDNRDTIDFLTELKCGYEVKKRSKYVYGWYDITEVIFGFMYGENTLNREDLYKKFIEDVKGLNIEDIKGYSDDDRDIKFINFYSEYNEKYKISVNYIVKKMIEKGQPFMISEEAYKEYDKKYNFNLLNPYMIKNFTKVFKALPQIFDTMYVLNTPFSEKELKYSKNDVGDLVLNKV